MPSTPLSAKNTRKAVHDLADQLERLDRVCGALYTRVDKRVERLEQQLPPPTLRGRLRWLLLGR